MKKWAKRLNNNFKNTYIIIGDENAETVCKIGFYRIMSRGFFKTGITVSPFFKQLALHKSKMQRMIIKELSLSGAGAIMLFGLTGLIILQFILAFHLHSFDFPLALVYIIMLFFAAGFIVFVARNSFGKGEFSDYDFWKNPQKFINHFK